MSTPDPDPAPPVCLLSLSPELHALVLFHLSSPEDLGRVDCVCKAFHDPPPPPPSPPSIVETALRMRAEACGRKMPARPPPPPPASCTQSLLWGERLDRASPPQPVAAGEHHSAFVNAEGSLLTCGADFDHYEDETAEYGYLGHGDCVTRLAVPTPVPSLQGVCIRSVSACTDHTLAVSEAGALFSFGNNSRGQLGHGDEDSFLCVPKQVESLRSVCVAAVSAGEYHSLVLSASGGVYSFGCGECGQLGHGDRADCHMPKLIEALQTRALSIAAGGRHSLVLDECSTVHTFGYGVAGSLGHGKIHTLLVPTPIPGLVARAISAGGGHSLVVAADGGLFAFGDNDHGQLGLGDYVTRLTPTRIMGLPAVQAVAAGIDGHSLVLARDGAVLSFGLTSSGQLGHGQAEALVTWEPREIEALRGVGVCTMAAGDSHSVVAAGDGRVAGFGHGEDERLGLSLAEHQLLPLEYPRLRVKI